MAKKKLYYYVPAVHSIEYYDAFIRQTIRQRELCVFDDYPTHKHKSSVCVDVCELIPAYRYKNTKALHYSKTHFETIELDDTEIITVDKKMYIKKLEQENNTLVWQEYCKWYKS